jgi:hypothetical protein
MKVLDVLAVDVGVLGIFSDWPGTVTYYANCAGLVDVNKDRRKRSHRSGWRREARLTQ